MSLRNVTINASSNSTQLAFAPASCTGAGWALNATKGGDLAYRSCTVQGKDNLAVNLTFTGVAIYYQSPFFDGLSLRFTLDGSPSSDINISHPRTSSSSSSSPAPTTGTIWQQLGLQNKTHVLEITPGAGGRSLNIGSFIVTESSPLNATTTTSKAPALAGPTQSETTTRVGIGFGATFGALAFIVFLWISWFLSKRRSRMQSKKYYDDWPQDHRDTPDDREIEFDRTVFSQSSQLRSPQSPPLPNKSIAMGSVHGKNASDSQDSLSLDGHSAYPGPSASEHGFVSPAPSNTHLLSQRAESSQIRPDSRGPAPSYTATYPTKLEPVRASPHSSLAPSPTTYTSSSHFSAQNRPLPLLSRIPEAVNVTRSATVPAPMPAALSTDVRTSTMTGGSGMTRGSTFSGKLEPVRKHRV